MTISKIRIRTRKGDMIERRATIQEWIDSAGRVSSFAQVGIHLYRIADRDGGGAIWTIA
jgi:hypothetical protein